MNVIHPGVESRETMVSLDLDPEDDYMLDSAFRSYEGTATPPFAPQSPRPPPAELPFSSASLSQENSTGEDMSEVEPPKQNLTTIVVTKSKSMEHPVEPDEASESLDKAINSRQEGSEEAETKSNLEKKQEIEAKLAAKLKESKLAVQLQNKARSTIKATRHKALAKQLSLMKDHYLKLIRSGRFKKTNPVDPPPGVVKVNDRARDNIVIYWRDNS